MTPEMFFFAIEILLVAALLVWFFARPWQAFCIDASRHYYFELRDRLFMLAVNRHIGFDDPVYRALREWLNHRIRLAHINVFGDIVAILIAHNGAVPKIQTLGNRIEKMEDESLRMEIRSIYIRAIQVQIGHMVVRSPVFLVLTILTPFAILVEWVNGGVRTISRWFTDLAKIADDDSMSRTRISWQPNNSTT